jgi:hypothetical protein
MRCAERGKPDHVICCCSHFVRMPSQYPVIHSQIFEVRRSDVSAVSKCESHCVSLTFFLLHIHEVTLTVQNFKANYSN